MNQDRSFEPVPSIPPAQGRALIVAPLVMFALAAGLLLAVVPGNPTFSDPRRLAFSYLTALLFLASICAGALAWLMLFHLTGATWSVVVRRLLENLTRPIPWLLPLFLVVGLSLGRLYPWADAGRVASDHELTRKAIWLNPTFYLVRTAVYLTVWWALAALLVRRSALQDRGDDGPISDRMRATSAWGLVLLGLTSSLAAFDWVMSLDPHWASTIFGVYFWAGSLASALAALIVMAIGLRAAGWLREAVTANHLHDLGKLLFGFVCFWAYIGFSQYFLIWYANFPEETSWYVVRRTGSWNTMSWALVLGHFVAPFVLLLFRASRRSPVVLGIAAAWILVFHYVDLFWMVMPSLRPEGGAVHWLDAVLVAAIVFLAGAVIARACLRKPLVPIGDPRLAESLALRSS